MNQTEVQALKELHEQNLSRPEAIQKLGWSPQTFHYRCQSLGLKFQTGYARRREQRAEKIRELANRDFTVQEIIKTTGIHRTYVYDLKKRLGIDIPSERLKRTDAITLHIIRLKNRGRSNSEIAQQLGLTISSIQRHLKRL